MSPWTLVSRSLLHYWRSHVAIVLGVAAASAVLGGSLLVGDSVRGSLADAALARLGRTTHAVESTGFFRAALVSDLEVSPGFAEAFEATVPVVALPGIATHAESGRRAGDVQVYGVDERFWQLQGLPAPPLGDTRRALLSGPLARELGAGADDAVVLRLDAIADIPGSSLFGRRDDPARGLRVRVAGILEHDGLGEFSLRPRAHGVRAAFVPLETLQRAAGQPDAANAVLAVAMPGASATEAIESALVEALTLEDLGVAVRALPNRQALQIETASRLIDDRLAQIASGVARSHGFEVAQVLVYLANTLRAGERQIPYSIVAGLDEASFAALGGSEAPTGTGQPPLLVLNDWAARDLGVAPGDLVGLDYYLWRDEGGLDESSAEFTLAAVAPLAGVAADPDLVPEYPGITGSTRLADWDPPFPLDLGRVREKDEAYWDDHRTTPKAFVPLEVAQRLWAHPQGRLTALRLRPGADADIDAARERIEIALLEALRPEALRNGVGATRLRVTPVREVALAAARGSTDFGQYFIYFSFFLVVSGLLLAGLFFRLGLERRLREVGLLEAVGFSAQQLRRQYLTEGLVLSGLGGVLGAGAAVGYASAVLGALRELWSEELGARALTLHLAPASPLLGALGAAAASVLVVAWTLRQLRRLSPRSLLAGALAPWVPARLRGRGLLPMALGALAGVLVVASAAGLVAPAAGFFGAGGALLVTALIVTRRVLSGRPTQAAAVGSVAGLGLRGLAFRPGRSVLCVSLVAAATFIIVSVGAFRHAGVDVSARDGQAGGYRLLAWSLAPLHHRLDTAEGREALLLEGDALEGVSLARFRARRAEDASCLNLFEPREPTVLAPSPDFVDEGRFAFAATLDASPQEQANPWMLLERERDADGVIPVIADAGSLQYILHRRLGDVMTLGETGVEVRFVASLKPGLFQSELLMGERHFVDVFPEEAGYRFFLVDVAPEREVPVREYLESHLSDFGFDVSGTAERLHDFHAVENTYIATFQALGALGLLLGTVGLGTVLVRNALEQRGSLALLRAVGYRRSHVTRMVLAENAALVGLGFLAGAVPAAVAIAPVLLQRGGNVPVAVLGVLCVALAATGGLVSWLAVAVIQRLPLLASLRAE